MSMNPPPPHECAICKVSIVCSNSASPSRFFIGVGRDRSQLGGTDQPCGCNRDVHKGAACLSVQFLESQRTSFKTHTQKEISVCANAFHQKPSISSVYQHIEWFKLTDLPTWKCNKAAPREFCLILPFIVYVWMDYYYKYLLIVHDRALKYLSQQGNLELLSH